MIWQRPGAIAGGLLIGLTIAAPSLAQPALQTYRARLFALQYPTGWFAEKIDSDYVILTNYRPQAVGTEGFAPRGAIKTDALIQDEAIGDILQRERHLAEAETEGRRMLRQEPIAIAGKQGYRLWLALDGFDFPHAAITYIPCTPRQTSTIATYYTSGNPEAEVAIRQIHGSLRCCP